MASAPQAPVDPLHLRLNLSRLQHAVKMGHVAFTSEKRMRTFTQCLNDAQLAAEHLTRANGDGEH
jgi:hypothetical protein